MYDFQFATHPTTRRAELRAEALALLQAPAFRVGQRVNVPALGLANVEVVEVKLSSVAGGETRYRVQWHEAGFSEPREANFLADELTVAE